MPPFWLNVSIRFSTKCLLSRSLLPSGKTQCFSWSKKRKNSQTNSQCIASFWLSHPKPFFSLPIFHKKNKYSMHGTSWCNVQELPLYGKRCYCFPDFSYFVYVVASQRKMSLFMKMKFWDTSVFTMEKQRVYLEEKMTHSWTRSRAQICLLMIYLT